MRKFALLNICTLFWRNVQTIRSWQFLENLFFKFIIAEKFLIVKSSEQFVRVVPLEGFIFGLVTCDLQKCTKDWQSFLQAKTSTYLYPLVMSKQIGKNVTLDGIITYFQNMDKITLTTSFKSKSKWFQTAKFLGFNQKLGNQRVRFFWNKI